MPRKPGQNSEFVTFDVVYEDGTRRSNRKVPRALTDSIDGDKRAHCFLIDQDRDVAEKTGKPPAKIKSITRSGAKKDARSSLEEGLLRLVARSITFACIKKSLLASVVCRSGSAFLNDGRRYWLLFRQPRYRQSRHVSFAFAPVED